jgi:trehalose synthase
VPDLSETGPPDGGLHEVAVAELPLDRLAPLIGGTRFAELEGAAERARSRLGDRVAWNVNSTAAGGGVAEMLDVLVGYIRGAGLDARWVVIEGDPRFFAVTKRLHNRLHGIAGDPGPLGPAEAEHYRAVTGANAAALAARITPGDVVVLHDPQTAGLAGPLAAAGARVVWRSHIGTETVNQWTDQAWRFLRPHLAAAHHFVFTRAAYAPAWLPASEVTVIAPSIDPFSVKNRSMTDDERVDLLTGMGLVPGPGSRPSTFRRADGSRAPVVHRATVVSDDGPPRDLEHLVVQVSRWDRLKDMAGVMAGFADRVVGRVEAQLALVGPSVDGVADDPEGAGVLAQCLAGWRALPAEARRRISLVTLPMEDPEENAAMVNALQRSALVVVQKSLVEGFGLTVAEGMWKAKPVVASRVGGIIDQVVPGTGILLDDPADVGAFGDALAGLLARPDEVVRMGANARAHVLAEYVGDRHLRQYAALLEVLIPR